MKLRMQVISALALAFALVVMGAPSALATTAYPDQFGTNIDFTGIQETSQFGDPEPLFGAPTAVGDQLLFFPAAFTSSASGAAGFDQTGSLLEVTMGANNPTSLITEINLTELGDYSLIAFGGGTAATGAAVTISGFVTVLADISGAISPEVIPFTGTITNGGAWNLDDDPSNGTWSGSISVDVASVVPNATLVKLSLNNFLFSGSEAGTTAVIQKKVVNGPAVTIEVVPEPGTVALIGTGLMLLGLRGRARRK